jgi:hypothetical protein
MIYEDEENPYEGEDYEDEYFDDGTDQNDPDDGDYPDDGTDEEYDEVEDALLEAAAIDGGLQDAILTTINSFF